MESQAVELRGKHKGEAVTIIGRGPSLLDIRPDDIGPGPVMVLNHAIIEVRRLELLNPIYSFQKDGCLVPPQRPEILILSRVQSRGCFADYSPRYVIDVVRLNLVKTCMSLTFAVAMAGVMGCKSARLLAFDSYTREDFRTVQDGQLVTIGRGYLHAANQAIKYAAKLGLPLEWG